MKSNTGPARYYPVHPAAECVRLMDPEELASLAASIGANGQRDLITLGRVNGDKAQQIVDGRNRLKACEIAGVEPKFQTIEFPDDEAVKAFVADKSEHRNLTKGQQAMRIALLFPEPEKGGRGKSKTKNLEETSGFSHKRLQQARAVNRFSPELARAVRDGIKSLDEALADVEAARKALDSDEANTARLRAEAPDLADLVDEGRVSLAEALKVLEERLRVAAEKERNQRETLIRSAEAAFSSIPSWAHEGFVAGVRERLPDPEFRDAFVRRVRPGSRPLEDIERGAAAFAQLLRELEKSYVQH